MEYVGIILTVALLFGLAILFLVFKTGKGQKPSGLNKKIVQDKWREIEALMAQGGPGNFQSAILEADKLLDYVLKAVVGTKSGQNMADRLKLAQKRFSSWETYQDAWSAHKVRNQMAHEVSHELHSSMASVTISKFKKVLRDLNSL